MRRVTVTPTGELRPDGKAEYIGSVEEFDGSVPADIFREMVQRLQKGEFVAVLEVI